MVLAYNAESAGRYQFWIFVTTDGAGHWRRQLTAPAPGDAGFGPGGWVYIHFFDATHGFAYAGTLYRTADGGATWSAVQTPGSGPFFTFTSPTRGWMLPVGNQETFGVYATSDGGSTWSKESGALPGSWVADPAQLAFRGDGEGWLGAALPTPTVFRTLDAGATWRSIPVPVTELGYDIYDTAVRVLPGGGVLAFASSPGGFLGGYYSEDQGASWSTVEPLPQPDWLTGASFLDSTHWWVEGHGLVYKTSTAGQDWARVPTHGIPEGWNVQPVHVIDAEHGWWPMISATNSNDSALMMTSDGGADWRAVSMPQPG